MSKLRILLVEDNREDESLTTFGLLRSDVPVEVSIARDGIQALENLFGTDHQFDLVLLDLKLPKLSGLGVLRRIRAEKSTRNLPVVILAASNEERDEIQCYSVGATRHLLKRLEWDRFVEALTDIIREFGKPALNRVEIRESVPKPLCHSPADANSILTLIRQAAD